MGYTPDNDHATRGPGAIAAIDRPGTPRAHRRMAAVRATAHRDRLMAAIERGALGRMDVGVHEGVRTTTSSRLGGSGPGAPAMRVAAPVSMVPPTIATPPRLISILPLPPVVAPTVFPVVPVVPMPPVAAPPSATPSPTTAATSATPLIPRVAMSSGAGSVQATGGRSVPAPAVIGLSTLPSIPDDSAPTSGGSGSSMRTVVLLGGAALLAYLLLRKKRGAR